MIYNLIARSIGQASILKELWVTQNGTYIAEQSGCDAFSKVTVNVSTIRLATPTVRQISNIAKVDDYNGVWVSEYEFYVDGVHKLTTVYPFAKLSDLFGENLSGSVKVRVKYVDGAVERSDFSSESVFAIEQYSDCRFTVADGYAKVVGFVDGENPTYAKIPSHIIVDNRLYEVTEIGEGAFQDKTPLCNISGLSIRKICARAFKGDSNLYYVDFPNLKEISGDEVFSGTAFTELKLKDLKRLDSVRILQNNVYDCTVKLPTDSEYRAILPYTFQGAKMSKLYVPPNVKRIDSQAFANSVVTVLEAQDVSDLEISKTAFSDSPLSTEIGVVVIKRELLVEYLSDKYAQTFGNLATTVSVAYGDTFVATDTINGKTCKFQVFANLDDLVSGENALNEIGVDFTSDGLSYAYAKVICQ